MSKVRLAPNPLPPEAEQIVFTRLELRPAQSPLEKLVHQPDSVGASHVGLAVSRHLRDPTLAHIPPNLAAVVSSGFPGKPSARQRSFRLVFALGMKEPSASQ